MPARDTQREKVYRAERDTFGHWKPGFATLEDLRESQQYANRVTSSKVWRELGGPPFVLVKDGRSRTRAAMVGRTAIAVPRWARSEAMILHELTHIMMFKVDRWAAYHGPQFVLMMRVLVEAHLGLEERQRYDHALEYHRAKWGIDGSDRLQRTLEKLQKWG